MSKTRYADHRRMLREYLANRSCPCPGCQYDLRDLEDDRCPECGLSIDEGYLRRHAARYTLRERITGETGPLWALLINIPTSAVWVMASAGAGVQGMMWILQWLTWLFIILVAITWRVVAVNERISLHFGSDQDRMTLPYLCITTWLMTLVHVFVTGATAWMAIV